MEDRCIFCGTILGKLQKRKLSCGNTEQILCKNCYPKYEPLSAIERAEAALKSGRAADAAELRKYLENVWDVQKKKEEEKLAAEKAKQEEKEKKEKEKQEEKKKKKIEKHVDRLASSALSRIGRKIGDAIFKGIFK